MSNCNNGVDCNVCHCKHNLNGCKCCLDKIQVSENGENGSHDHHFCKSYCNKDCK